MPRRLRITWKCSRDFPNKVRRHFLTTCPSCTPTLAMVGTAPPPMNFNTSQDPSHILAQAPGLVSDGAEKLLQWAKGEAVESDQEKLWQTAYFVGFLGSATHRVLEHLVYEESKRKLCKAFAAAMSTGNPERDGRLNRVPSEALDSVTPWTKDFTFVSLLLNKKVGLGKAIGLMAETTRAAGKCLALYHAETIAQLCVNISIGLMTPDARRDEPPGFSELLSNGVFRALLEQCEGEHVVDPRLIGPAGAVLEMVSRRTATNSR